MGHKLLLADDSTTIQRVIELTFASEDVQVLSVADGEQAIARIPAERPDIVLADIGMPKRSGYEVSAFVKATPEVKHIPVLLLAGAFEPIDHARVQAVGSSGVLVKPFEPQHVIARVRELLERSQPAPSPSVTGELRAGDRPVPPARTIEFPRSTAGKPLSLAPERHDLAAPPDDERLVASPYEQFLPRESPGAGSDESIDDYFDRLDAAFATLETSPIGHPVPATRDEVLPDEALSIPTLDDLLGGSGYDRAEDDRLWHASAADAVVAPEVAAPAPVSEPILTDALIDEVTRRVLVRIGPEAVREVVRDIVSDVAERLVRDEIERIRSRQMND